jgi:hypothetical protein
MTWTGQCKQAGKTSAIGNLGMIATALKLSWVNDLQSESQAQTRAQSAHPDQLSLPL